MYSMIGCHYFKDKLFPITLRRHIRHKFQVVHNISRLQRIFQSLDKNRDGKITRQEFLDGCMADKQILNELETLRTVW